MTEQEAQELIESINLERLKEYARLIVTESKSLINENLVNKATEDVFQFAAHELKSLLAKREIAKFEARSQTSTLKPSTLLLQIEIKAQREEGNEWLVQNDTTIVCFVEGYSQNRYVQEWMLNPTVQCFVNGWYSFSRLKLTKQKDGSFMVFASTWDAAELSDYVGIWVNSVKIVESFPVPEM